MSDRQKETRHITELIEEVMRHEFDIDRFRRDLEAVSIEQEILEFAEHHWGCKDLRGVCLKLMEEAGEVAGAVVKIPEGRATEQDLFDEMGDVLIVLSQLAAKHNKTLAELRANRFEHVKERNEATTNS
jgi:NTP pyrophosphatase (non-canonical NTP hydrolase)